jgi:D-alanyl-D-alanine dipeptidase
MDFSLPTQFISLADPQILAVEIHENFEEMVDLRDQREIAFGPSPEIPDNKDYTKMRKGIYEKLLQAQEMLPHGLKFCLYEAYRSLELQQTLFNNRYSELKSLHSSWKHEELFQETTKLVSPTINRDDSKNIPPHSTGGAIDIYLIDEAQNPVDMGILVKDWMKDLDGSLSQTNSSIISAEAIKYRAIMGEILSTVGFVNYPTEYWHWSYGDRYWAYHKGELHALYGSV